MTTSPGPAASAAPAPDGIVVVDKPAGWTSHDVVGRVRRLARTRRVGHAGTLDPMATGVLVVGVGRATRLLGHLSGADKDYLATVRLGQQTTTDDADGEPVHVHSAAALGVDAVEPAVAGLRGTLEQVPPAYSAIKVAGRRSYARARAGERVELPARTVTVSRLDLTGFRRAGDCLDVDLAVTCSSGTYVRALARDLGAALGVGGHLTALRRTRVGGFDLTAARTLEQFADEFRVVPLDEAVAAAFPRIDLDAAQTRSVSHGNALPLAEAAEAAEAPAGGPVGAFGPDGEVVALVERRGGALRPLAVFTPA